MKSFLHSIKIKNIIIVVAVYIGISLINLLGGGIIRFNRPR